MAARPAKQDGRIPSLDGLRGVAILLVIVAHATPSIRRYVPQGLLDYAGNGALGVNIFFVLSGFLIYNLSVREIDRTGAFDWRQFYIRRVLRIFPCFYLYIATVTVLVLLGILSLTPQWLLAAASFSLNYRHLWDTQPINDDYFVIGHYWTLTLEEQFYLTWPLLMLLFARRKLLPVLACIVVLAPVLRVVVYFASPISRGQLMMMFHTGFDAIAAGVLLGEVFRRAAWRSRLEALSARPLVLASALLTLFVVSPTLGFHFRGAYNVTIGRTLDLACICLLITAAVTHRHTLLFSVLNWKPLAFIGVLSYSLYVWNNLFLYPDGPWTLHQFPYNLVALFAVAMLCHYLVERPFLRLKGRFSRSARGGGDHAQAAERSIAWAEPSTESLPSPSRAFPEQHR